MDETLIIVVVVIVVVAIAAFALLQKRRTGHLQSRFGPEYERQVDQSGSRTEAEADLAEREKRVKKLDIKPLGESERHAFTDRWSAVQAKFVDDPGRAVDFADALIAEVMTARGYPVKDFDQRVGDVSVDHPLVAQSYHAGHEIAERHQRGEASTEELRQAMIHYRELFEELASDS
ncbi:MAG: hypothetical protein H0V46_04090 [Sphingomonas sp.]|nr:hypothetical protein [Sphingomonas sp.]